MPSKSTFSCGVRVCRLVVPFRSPHGCRTVVLHGVFREFAPWPRVGLSLLTLSPSKIIMFSDLECDYINPIDLCNKLNQVCVVRSTATHHVLSPQQFVLPENIAHAFLTLLFLLSGQWTAFLLNLPLVVFNANKSVILASSISSHLSSCLRIRNKNHMYDATEIFRSLSGHKKESFIKLGFYLLSFFYYLYRFVRSLV